MAGVTGFRHTDETKRKLSDLRRGDKNPFFGRQHTPEFKAAQSARTSLRNRSGGRFYGLNKNSISKLTQCDAAYLAAMIDGEGSICLPSGRRGCYVGVYNTSIALMEWLKEKTSRGYHKQGSTNPIARQQCWRWTVTAAADLIFLLQSVRPYLIIKGDKADAVLAYLHKKYEDRL